ncbi:rCG50516, isoform CRA_b, partial [Rattus norvegicus]
MKSLPGIPPSPAPAIATLSQAPSQPQASQTLTPLAVQAAPQVLTQESLATVLTGVMVPAGAVTQPLLIPIGITGQVAGQQGLAVWTIPTATVAALPGLTAASPTGGAFKPPLAGLQGNGNSPQDCIRPPPPYAAAPQRVFTVLDSEHARGPPRGNSPGFWIQCHRHPATELLHWLGTLGQD